MRKNIFVVGLDALNRATLEETPELARYQFHGLLDATELIGGAAGRLTKLERGDPPRPRVSPLACAPRSP